MITIKKASLLIVGDKVMIEPFVGVLEVDEITSKDSTLLCCWVVTSSGRLTPVGMHPDDLIKIYVS
ncbi:MAG: hypothetical protein ABJA76_09515 [Mucilaginibacter sp.]